MQIISFLNQISKTINVILFVVFISSISLVVWLIAQNLWSLGNYSNIEPEGVSFEYNYFILSNEDHHANLPFSQQKILSKKENVGSSRLNAFPYRGKITLINHTQDQVTRILSINAPSEQLTSIHQSNEEPQYLSEVKRDNSVFQHMFPHISITLPPQTSKTFLLKLTANKFVPVNMYKTTFFDRYIQNSIALFGAFIGVILLMAIYNIVLYLSLKDKVYFTYVGYLIFAFLVFSTMSGFGYLIFSNNIQLWLNQQVYYFQYALNIYLILFSLFFLQDRITKDKVYRVKLALSFNSFILLVIAGQLVLPNNLVLFIFFQAILCIFCLFIVFKNVNKKFLWAKYYYISWVPFLVGSITQYLLLIGLIDASFINTNAFILGVILQVGFISLALTQRLRKNEQYKLHHLTHHSQSGLPRQINLVNKIKELSHSYHLNQNFYVVIIQPEHIDKIKNYVDNSSIFELFKRINNSLSMLFENNNAVLPLTINNEKICYIHGNFIGFIVNIDELDISSAVFFQYIQTAIRRTYTVKDLNLSLTGLIGIAHYPNQGLTSQDLIKNAILAIREAEKKPEKWSFYETHTQDNSAFLLELAADIQHALRKGEFEMYHQPQIDLKTSKVCGSECLIRWNHPTKGFIPPTLFIPVAEDMGLINKITLWVLKQSLTQHHKIIEEYNNHMVSINISGINLTSNGFHQQMIEILDNFTIPTEKIIFEITESANIATNEHAVHVIDKLTSLGLKVSIDDFGTGYSSLANLDKLPFQELKIDKQFVENIHNDNKRRVIAETTVKMAKGVGLEVVAEGITTQQDEKTLIEFGCDIGQGYYYSEALPIDEYLKWLSVQLNGKVPNDFYGEFIPKSKS